MKGVLVTSLRGCGCGRWWTSSLCDVLVSLVGHANGLLWKVFLRQVWEGVVLCLWCLGILLAMQMISYVNAFLYSERVWLWRSTGKWGNWPAFHLQHWIITCHSVQFLEGSGYVILILRGLFYFLIKEDKFDRHKITLFGRYCNLQLVVCAAGERCVGGGGVNDRMFLDLWADRDFCQFICVCCCCILENMG